MEKIMKQAGSCGRFQVVQVFCICLPRFVFMWAAFMMMFGNYNPGWRCRNNNGAHTAPPLSSFDLNHTEDSSEFVAGGGSDQNNLYSTVKSTLSVRRTVLDNALQDVGNYSLDYSNVTTNNRSNDDVINDVYDGTCDVIDSCVDGIEFNPESSTIITEFGLVCDREWFATVIIIAVNAGFIFGQAIIGQVGESYGRKAGMYGSMVVVMVASGAAIFSPNWQTYACFLFLMAAGSMGGLTMSLVFMLEVLNSKWRGFTASRPIVSLSLCAMSMLMLLLKDWRHIHIATTVVSFVSCCGYAVVVESPRWLFVNSQLKKAEKIIQKIAKRNRKPPIDKDSIDSLLESYQENEREQQRQSYTYLDLFRSKEHRMLALKTSIIFTLNYLIYRALTFGLKSVPGNFYKNALVSTFLLAGLLVCAGPVTNCLGRRRAGFLFPFLGSVSCLLIVLSLFITDGYTQETVIQICAYVSRAMTQAAIGAVFLLAAELFPTAIRSVALAFCNIVANAGAVLCAFVIPRDNDTVSFAVCFAVMAGCYLVTIGIVWSLPETNKSMMKDSLELEGRMGKNVGSQDDINTTTFANQNGFDLQSNEGLNKKPECRDFATNDTHGEPLVLHKV